MNPRGRRPGGADTRTAILEAARGEFAARGYAGASLRGIARAAGVDPRLVHHYFEGGKSALFTEVMAIPLDPAATVAKILQGPPEQIGERIVRTFLTVWDDPQYQPTLVGFIRSVFVDDALMALVQGYIATDIFGQVVAAHPHARQLPPRERALRAGLIASQMLGLALGRYVVGLPGLVRAPARTLVERIAPVIQGHLER